MIYFFQILLFISLAIATDSDCIQESVQPINSETKNLEEMVDKVVQKSMSKVVDFSVNMDGAGSIDVLIEDGEMVAIRFNYVNSIKKTKITMDINDLNAGKSMEYTNSDVPGIALSLTKAPGVVITGTEAPLIINYRSEVEPNEYKKSLVTIKKINGQFKLISDDKLVEAVELEPEIIFPSFVPKWKGSFKSLKFK